MLIICSKYFFGKDDFSEMTIPDNGDIDILSIARHHKIYICWRLCHLNISNLATSATICDGGVKAEKRITSYNGLQRLHIECAPLWDLPPDGDSEPNVKVVHDLVCIPRIQLISLSVT